MVFQSKIPIAKSRKYRPALQNIGTNNAQQPVQESLAASSDLQNRNLSTPIVFENNYYENHEQFEIFEDTIIGDTDTGSDLINQFNSNEDLEDPPQESLQEVQNPQLQEETPSMNSPVAETSWLDSITLWLDWIILWLDWIIHKIQIDYTKFQFVTDDPPFLVLICGFMFGSLIIFSIALRLHWTKTALFILLVVIDSIGATVVVSTFFWYLCNKFLARDTAGGRVEWAYALYVHINACFPPQFLLHFVQMAVFIQALVNKEHQSCWVSNSFLLGSLIYYIYITFLGYSNLPNVRNARVLLLPIPAIFLLYLISLGFEWDLSQMLIDFYRYRVV